MSNFKLDILEAQGIQCVDRSQLIQKVRVPKQPMRDVEELVVNSPRQAQNRACLCPSAMGFKIPTMKNGGGREHVLGVSNKSLFGPIYKGYSH